MLRTQLCSNKSGPRIGWSTNRCPRIVQTVLPEKSGSTIRTVTMSEACPRVVSDVVFDLAPVAVVVPNLFAGGANREEASQCFDLSQRRVQLADERFALRLGLPAIGNIFHGTDVADDVPSGLDGRRTRIDPSHLAAGLLDPKLAVKRASVLRAQSPVINHGLPIFRMHSACPPCAQTFFE